MPPKNTALRDVAPLSVPSVFHELQAELAPPVLKATRTELSVPRMKTWVVTPDPPVATLSFTATGFPIGPHPLQAPSTVSWLWVWMLPEPSTTKTCCRLSVRLTAATLCPPENELLCDCHSVQLAFASVLCFCRVAINVQSRSEAYAMRCPSPARDIATPPALSG